MFQLDEVDLLAPSVEAESNIFTILGDVLVQSHCLDFDPMLRLKERLQVIDNYLSEAVRAFYGEERVIAQSVVNILTKTVSAEFMAAFLKPI